MLWLVQRVFFGPLREPKTATTGRAGDHAHNDYDDHISTDDHPVQDMNYREVLALAPLAVFVFWIGLVPGTFLQAIGPAVKQVQEAVAEPFDEHYAATRNRNERRQSTRLANSTSTSRAEGVGP